MRHVIWTVAALLIISVWINWTETGRSRPDAPDVLKTTFVARACGFSPYLVRDQNGTRLEPEGLVIGGVVTFLIVLTALRLSRLVRERRAVRIQHG